MLKIANLLTKDQLYKQLSYVDHSRNKRQLCATIIIENSYSFSLLLDIVFDVDDKMSCRAAWVLEFVCKANLELIIPHLNRFTKNISKVHLDPAVRPVAKICEYLITANYSKYDNSVKTNLSENHKTKITEACFDWMINDEKVAPKAYAMNALYLLGNEYDWIHPELKIILERDFQIQSSGFKARARHILKKI